MGSLQPRHAVPVGEEYAPADPLLPSSVASAGGDGAVVNDVEQPRDALGRVVRGLLHTVFPGRGEALRAPRAAALVRQLRQQVAAALFTTVLTLPIAAWLLVRGVAVYFEVGSCSMPLQLWLILYLVAQLLWPACMPSMQLLLLVWCLGGVLIVQPASDCPTMHEFVFEALALNAVSSVFLSIAVFSAVRARPLLQQIGELLNYHGTNPEVVSAITVLLPEEILPEEECVICLTRDDEDGVPWRELICGHRFHEPCLLSWLAKAHRCPICRFDLHAGAIVEPSAVHHPL